MKNCTYSYLALGSSLVMDGIDAELLSEKGLTSYNLALGGANLKSNYIQLNHYLENNNNPECVLLGIKRLNNLGKNKSEKIHPIVGHNYRPINWLNYKNLPMIRFKWLAVEMLKLLVSEDHRNADVVLGQYRTRRQVGDQTKYNNKKIDSFDFASLNRSKYLRKINSLCKTNNIKLLVFEMPDYRKNQNKNDIGPYNKNDIIFVNLNNYDLCSMLFDSNTDWMGNGHVNEFGAKKLTHYIYKEVLIKYSKNK